MRSTLHLGLTLLLLSVYMVFATGDAGWWAWVAAFVISIAIDIVTEARR